MAVGRTLFSTALLLLLIFSTPTAIARKVQSEPSRREGNGAAGRGFQAELIRRGKEGLSTSENLAADIKRGCTRAKLLGAIASADAYKPLRQALKDKISYPKGQSPQPDLLDLCYELGTRSPRFPTITFHFDGVDLTLPSENSFFTVDLLGETYCLAMATAYDSLNIFGSIQQANYNILYDSANSRMGFLPMKCGQS